MKELVFDTQGLDEERYVAFCEGVQAVLEKLDIEFEYDEMSPNLDTYKVVFEKSLMVIKE